MQCQVRFCTGKIEVSAYDHIVCSGEGDRAVRLHHSQRAGDKEAEAALSCEVVWLQYTQFVRCAVAIRIEQVKHVAMSGVVGRQPATVGLQLCHSDGTGEIQFRIGEHRPQVLWEGELFQAGDAISQWLC